MTDADTIAKLQSDLALARDRLLRAGQWFEVERKARDDADAVWEADRAAERAKYRAALQPFADAYRRSLPVEEGGYGPSGEPCVTLAQCAQAALALELAAK